MVITIVLLHKDMLFQRQIELGQELSIGSHKKDDVFVPDFMPEQIRIRVKNNGIALYAKKAYNFERESLPMDTIISLDKMNGTAVYFSSMTSKLNKTIKLPYNCSLKFGRGKDNDVVMKLPFVSGKHFVLKKEAGNVRVEDLDSTNGLYLNGKRVRIAKMKSGDVLSILDVNIRLINGELYFENVKDRVFFADAIGAGEGADSGHLAGQTSRLVYHRSPRTQEQLPSEDIILSNAPSKGQKFEKSRGMFSSIAGSSAMFAANMFIGAASPALLAARAASLVSPVASVASSGGNNKRRKKNLEQYEAMRREKYGAYIDDQKARIESVAQLQREILTRENPTPRESMDVLFGLRRNLWERMPQDRDYLDVRMGMGYENLCVNVKSRQDNNAFQMEDDEIRELSEQIIEETRIVDNVPSRVSLYKNPTIGLVGDRRKMIRLVKNMLISLTVAHSFEDVRIVGIFDKSERSAWESLKWLPHIWDDNRQFRFLSFDRENAHNICDILNDVLKKRRDELKGDSYKQKIVQKPHYIFLLGAKEMVEKEQIMHNLILNNPDMGATALFMFNDLYQLPPECNFIIDMDNGPCAYERSETNNKFFFTMDPATDDALFDNFARRMSAIELEGLSAKSALPNGIAFLKGYGVETVEQLNIWENWTKSKPEKSLAAPIGVLAGGKTLNFDIHEKVHGPHGLVAGTTGSGKSELLLTYILSMCVQFHPDDINFVLIDYKGGGMANVLEPLPHVVGKMTNISSNISRILLSLAKEIKRREEIFATCGLSGNPNIYDYQKAYKEGRVKEVMPHLIIVSDEFAELKKENPEFIAQLVQTARVGRSLGIHLILATQKPGGVVDDQIMSNSRFRLCMKVQDVTDSREMIKRPDAAKLTQVGRSYLRVGEDEYFELFQSYWSGAPYFGATERSQPTGNQVRIVETNGKRIKTYSDEKTRFKSDLNEITAIVRHICAVAQEKGVKKLQGPWLPELPESVTLEELPDVACFDGTDWPQPPRWLTAPIGMYDNPREQAQGAQVIDFSAEGHYGIYGAPGTGKTTLLKSLVFSLGMTYSPKDVNVYILDCGGWGMSVFSNMPHVGGVALDTEEEKFRKFEKLIMEELESRKKVFLKNAVSSLAAYRESVSEDMPAIIIAIDNIVPIFDLYPDFENFLITLAQTGSTYGVYLVYTANSTSGVRYKVLQNIRGAVTFELTDKGDYTTIVGRLDGMTLPKVMGRAFFKGSSPIEFQAALPCKGENDRQMTLNLKETISKMNTAWKGVRPKPIPIMPETVTAEYIRSEYNSRLLIPVGIDCENIRTAYVDLSSNYSLMVTGAIQSGKSRYLCSLGEMVKAKFEDTSLYVFDSKSASMASFADTAKRYGVVNNEEEISAMLNELVDILNTRKKEQNQARAVEGDSFDEKKYAEGFPLVCLLVDDLKEYVETVSDENKNTMERICRMAENLGVIVLSGGRVADMTKLNEIESLTRSVIGNQNGLALGGTPAQYGYFQNNLKYSEKDVEAGEGFGYLFINGKCGKIKLFE